MCATGRKIEATIRNARVAQELIDAHGSFAAYLRSMDDLGYEARSRVFCKQFKFIGPLGAYFFFHSVGEEVPPWDEWRAQHAEG